MKKTQRSWNSTLRTESVKHREMRLAGLLPKKTAKPIRKISNTMSKRIRDWRKTAREKCTFNGQLYCALCGLAITDGIWDAHHYKERRGQAHSRENDKYVVALHRTCHNNIDHYSEDYDLAREKIEKTLENWEIKKYKKIFDTH